MEQLSGPDPASAQAERVSPADAAPPALDDDDDVIDAEIADVPGSAFGTASVGDYSEAGVPSLDYLRERIERRYGTTMGSVGLAEAAAEREAPGRAASEQEAARIAAERRTARDQAATDKLAEIRRSLHP